VWIQRCARVGFGRPIVTIPAAPMVASGGNDCMVSRPMQHLFNVHSNLAGLGCIEGRVYEVAI
jgi:hypothetical protein